MRLLHTLMKMSGMASNERKTKMEEKELDLKQIAKELDIDKPIMSCRVVGSRVEVWLTGGDMLYWPPEPDKPTPDPYQEGGGLVIKKETSKKKAKKK